MLLAAPAGWLGLVFIVVALILYAVASDNADDCSAMKCTHGRARLLDHECVCVETPKP